MRWHTGAQTEIVAGEMQTNINLSVLAGGCLPVWCLLSLFQDPSCSSKIRTHTHKIKSCLMWHRMPGILCILFFLIHDQKKLLDWGMVGSFFFFFFNKSFIFFFIILSDWKLCAHIVSRGRWEDREGGGNERGSTDKWKNRQRTSKPMRQQPQNFNTPPFSSDGWCMCSALLGSTLHMTGTVHGAHRHATHGQEGTHAHTHTHDRGSFCYSPAELLSLRLMSSRCKRTSWKSSVKRGNQAERVTLDHEERWSRSNNSNPSL